MTTQYIALNRRVRELAVKEIGTQNAIAGAAADLAERLRALLNAPPEYISVGSDDSTGEFAEGRIPEFDGSHSSSVVFRLIFPGAPAPREPILSVKVRLRHSRFGVAAELHARETLLTGGGSDMRQHFANEILSEFEKKITQSEEKMNLRQ